MAQNIYDKLTTLGYSVSYDINSMPSGRFDVEILRQIEEADDFVLILSSGCLDRCFEEGDWLYNEISHAIECKKNIVPVMLRDFVFPSILPESIDCIRNYNGVPFGTMDHFSEKMSKLVSYLSVSANPKPTNKFSPDIQKRINKAKILLLRGKT